MLKSLVEVSCDSDRCVVYFLTTQKMSVGPLSTGKDYAEVVEFFKAGICELGVVSRLTFKIRTKTYPSTVRDWLSRWTVSGQRQHLLR